MKQIENKNPAKLRFCRRPGGVLFFSAAFALLCIVGTLSCVPESTSPGSDPDNTNSGSDPDNTNPGGDQGKTDGALSPNAQRLMNYLIDQYGTKIISGQMDTAWTENRTMDMIARVFADTGKYPAIKGFDFIDLPHSWSGYGKNQADEAIEWWEGKNKMNGNSPAAQLLADKPDIHGIVTFCWHWRVRDTEQSETSYNFYTYGGSHTNDGTKFTIPMNDNKLDTSSPKFQSMKSDLDKVAALLKLLKDRDIPVLWRPLHEASGGWFWWGASGENSTARAAACVALWEYMYDYFTNEKGLDNLIWVWNGQNASWFPNPDTVHIISYDVYTNANTQATAQDYTSSTFGTRFTSTKNTPPEQNLMVALSENGAIPDPQWSLTNNYMWSWFLTWNDANSSTTANRNNFWIGGYHNTAEHKQYVYDHELVITLDELPDLTAYRLE